MPLKLGCPTMTYLYRCSLDETLSRIAALGFRQIELMTIPPHLWPRDMSYADRVVTRRLLEKHGLQPVTLNLRQSSINLASVNSGIREESIRQLKETIELTGYLGAPMAIVVPGNPTPTFGPPPEEIWRLAREGVMECVEYAARRGVTCVLENAGFSLCRRGEDLKRMAAEVDSEHCKILYDVANANTYEPPADSLRDLAPWLAGVHLADNDGSDWTHLSIGRGNIDFAAVASILGEIGFSGISMLDVFVREGQDEVLADCTASLTRFGWVPG